MDSNTQNESELNGSDEIYVHDSFENEAPDEIPVATAEPIESQSDTAIASGLTALESY